MKTTASDSDDGFIVRVNNLSVTFITRFATVHAVREASFGVKRGEVLGLVGESGCGKSSVAAAIMGYTQATSRIEGDIFFRGKNTTCLNDSDLRKLRGNRISMVFQDPSLSLNPSMRIGAQVEEFIRSNPGITARQAHDNAVSLFGSLSNIPGSVYGTAKETPASCLFEPRCPVARQRCRDEAPDIQTVERDHSSRCFFAREVSPDMWHQAIPPPWIPFNETR
jgi:oligopeptide/dipeptide ABC transporter ATP-binding protein